MPMLYGLDAVVQLVPVSRAVFDGGGQGVWPPLQEVADPPRKFCKTSLGGVDSNPPKNPMIPFSC